jgi:hypothetical protein
MDEDEIRKHLEREYRPGDGTMSGEGSTGTR